MSDELRRARLTKLLALLLIFAGCFAQTQGDRQQQAVQDARIQRAQRDLDGVATVLLVSAKPGKSSPPLGILTKTARTFVQDGASTEYATQVLGTTLANGRLYARILSTSSRVFYEKQTPKPDPTPGSDPYVVYPSQTTRITDWQLGIALDNAVADEIIAANDEAARLDEISERENDVFGASGPGRPDGFKPAKVRPANNLPTYTVGPAETYESSSTVRAEGSRFAPKDRNVGNNARPKLFGAQAKNEARKLNEPKIADPKLERRQRNGKTLSPLNTVTYHGFADFTTTVGDTVIVFSPSTAPAPSGRPATTIKGAATLRPGIGMAVKEIHATSVKNAASPSTALHVDSGTGVHDATEAATNEQLDDPLLEAINGRRQHPTSLEPSTTGVAETEPETRTETTPLLISETTTVQTSLPEKPTSPTGLLSSVVSTTSDHGTTTLYKSLIYGTYVGTDYARVTHTASDVYFFPDDEATVAFGTDDTSSEGTTTTEKVTMESNELTTTFDGETTNGLPTTLNHDEDDDEDAPSTFMGPKGGSTIPMPRDATEPTPAASPTTEKEIANDILQVGDHQGRSIKTGTKNQLPSDEKKGMSPVDRAPPASSTTVRLVPTTVYKTFTRMTTFYIPDENDPDMTTTSVKTGEAVSSEVSYLTEFAATTTMQHSSAETTMFTEDTTNEPTTIGVADSTMEDSAEEPKTTVEEEAEPEQTTKQDEEIELIFKTLYTTYTYLTTFFHETTSSVSSREVVETNVVTQTVGPYYDVSADIAGLFGKDRELGVIAPTMVPEHGSVSPTMMPVTPSTEETRHGGAVEEEAEEAEEENEEEEENKATQATGDETSTTTTTLETEETDVPESMANPTVPSLEPTPMLSPSKEEKPQTVERTYYTTFTYFTSIFVEGETEVLTRTTVQSNVVTETIAPSTTISYVAEQSSIATSDEDTSAESPRESSSESPTTLQATDSPVTDSSSGKAEAPPDILAYLAAIQGQKSAQEALEVARRVQQKLASDEPTVTEDTPAETSTTIEPETSPPADEEVLETMVTDVVSTSSSGGGTLISGTTPAMNDDENDNGRNPPGSINAGALNAREPEDQELSESNTSNHEIEPAPTLLLQTSYTTFTYFTTMYRGDASSVVSRLETVTNVVTETIRPSMEASDSPMPIEPTSTLPVTYFTTFTYWTTFYRGGDTLTTSREKTVSNVVYPGSDSGSLTMTESELPKATEIFGNEVLGSTIPIIHIPVVVSTPLLDEVPTVTSVPTVLALPGVVETSHETSTKASDIIAPSLSTVYTTLTYFTTSYSGDSTVLHSRLETITSVISIQPTPSTAIAEAEVDPPTARAIDGGAVQAIDTRDKPDLRPTGLISTIRTSVVNDGTTTHLATDIHGTYVNGLYARVLESSTSIEVPSPSSASASETSTTSARPTPVLPTGILSLDHGSIVDADQITTVYFTTRQIGTVVDGLYAKIIESESRTSIDEAREASIAPTRTSGTPHRTGLVRVIEGRIEANDTTTFYRSRVIGTSIDGRYAQIIESTSSWAKATPTKTASADHGIAATSTIDAGSLASSVITKDESAAGIHPSPAVVQSSMPEDASSTTEHPGGETSHEDDEEHDGEDDNEDGEGAGDGEDDDDDDGQRSKKKTRLTFSTKKRTFTPLIRPFASRNRPTFNPKRKGIPQGATTITRTDITPTITATLASGKGNRFSNSRSRLNSPTGPYSSSLYQQQSSGSRRFSGRRSSATVTPSSGYPSGSSRGRASSRISPSSVYSGRRASTGSGPNSVGPGGRGGFASRTASPFSGGRPIGSSVYGGPLGSSRYRPGGSNNIRASSTLLRGQATVRNEDQDEDANDFSATTLVTEDTPTSLYTDPDDIDGATTPIQTTTESSRRSTNPLLRFRRPFGIGNGIQGRTIGTPRTPAATTTTTTPSTPRRTGNLLARPNNPVGRRPSLPITPRPRTPQTNSLFPPRGLFNNNNRRPETTEAIDVAEPNDGEDEASSENSEDDRFEDVDEEPIEEIADNDYEGSEREETAAGSTNRRSSNLSTVRIRPFAGFAARNAAAGGRRVRRQASQLRSLTSRFRRPGTSTATQQAAQTEDKEEPQRSETEDTSSSAQRPKSSSRYGTRGRSSTTSSTKPGNKDEAVSQSPSSSSSSSSSANRKQRTRTKPSTSSGTRSSSASSSSPRVRPSPTSSSGRQFTLREKDSGSSSRPGYKRTSTGSSSRSSGSSNRPDVSSRPRPPRLRGSSSRPTHSETPSSSSSSRRLPSNSRARTNSRTSSSGNRRVPSQRGSTREESQNTLPDNDGTITVTHYVPTEVTIPVVNNGVTEHRNVITAQPSIEILGPDRYSTVIGGDGKPLVVIAGEVTGTNGLGQTEVTRFLLHESSTTSIMYAPTNLGGRRTSYSRIVPSTVYSVENVVSTKQPALPAANAPLANILLSQLLLGQLGQANPLLGGFPQQPQQPQQPVTPSTRYDTRTTSYVTTITKEQSTVIPLTFRGKEILTTLVDSTTNVITATEYVTDTVVVTPTVALPAAGPNPVELNSLLLLLQQPQQPQPLFSQPNAFDPLFASAIPSLTRSNTLAGEAERRQQPADLDYKPYKDSDSYEDGVAEASWEDDDVVEDYSAPRRPDRRGGSGSRTKSRGYGNKPSYKPSEESTTPAPSPSQVEESSVITLYVSGRRPGEFSTVLSTVRVGEDATRVRRRRDLEDDYPQANDLESSRMPFSHLDDEASIPMLAGSEELVAAHAPTQSLESVVGDVAGRRISASDARETEMDTPRGSAPTFENDVKAAHADPDDSEPTESEGPKRLRIRIPVVRKVARANDSPHRRRFVVTRVRALGLRTRDNEDEQEDGGGTIRAPAGHRITITRRRKILPTGIGNEEKTRPRITRKKLVKVRPLEQLPTPTPTLSIITTGFYGSDVSSSTDDDASSYGAQDYEDDASDEEDVDATATPLLEVKPETIENRPMETSSEIGETTTEVVPNSPRETPTPVILTDHFFLPPSHEDAEGEEEYDDDEEEEEEAEEVEDTTTPRTLSDDVQTTETSNRATESTEDERVATEATIPTNEPVQTEDPSIATEHVAESSTESTSNEELGTTVPGLLDGSKNTSEWNDHGNSIPMLDDASNIPEGPETIAAATAMSRNPLVSQNATSKEPRLETTITSTASTVPVELANATVINDRPRSTDSPVTFASLDLVPAPVSVRSDEPSSDPVPSLATNHIPRPSSTTASAPFYDADDDDDDDDATPTANFRYSETVVTSTRLRTYTYVVTKLNGLVTEVTSSTEVRPKVTTLTLTLTLPYAAAASTRSVPSLSDSTLLPGSELLPSPTQISTSMPLADNDGDDGAAKTNADDNNDGDDEQGRRFNLATRIMSNGVGVIVAASAGSSSHIAPRWENPSPSIARPPTLTVSDALVMLMPRDTEPREFVTKTCTTTFAYLGTYVDDTGVTRVTTRQEIVYNTATEERHGTVGSAASGITLEASPTLGTEVFETTYTYLDVSNAEGPDPETRNRSTVIVTNTVTAPQRYLDVILEPSETPRPETNAYPSTRTLERTFTDEAGRITIRPVNDVVTRLVVTESARAPRPASTIEASSNDHPVDADGEATPDVREENVDDDVISRTYFVTYSYYRTLVEDGSTVVHTNVATSSDVVTEKVPAKRIGSTKPASIVTEATPSHASPEPIQIFATKTYLTTYTYFTTLLQADTNGETSTTVSSRSRVVENVVTESIAPSLLEANDYASALLRTVVRPTPTHVAESSAETSNGQQFEGINNVVTGSTIIFFDEEDQIDSSATVESTTPLATEILSTTPTTKNREPAVVEEHMAETHSTTSPSTPATAQASISQENDNATSAGGSVGGGGSFGSLGPFSIHGLSALGPVITAMAGLLQGKTTSATRRNDTVTPDVNSIFDNLTTHRHRDHNEPYEDDISATRRSPVYIPVAEFADASDIETAESQNIGNRLAANLNRNYIPESRHKVAAASLVNGIPISPGEVITANSDVIIGKPGKLGPRPPQRDYANDNDHVEMLPPPIASGAFDASLYQHSLQRATVEQQQKHQQQDNDVDATQIQIVPARQVFEEHLRFTSASKDRESSVPPQSGAPRPAVFRPPAPRPAARPPSYVQQQQQQQQQQISSGHSQSRLDMESNRRATAAALPDDPLLKPPGLMINALPAPVNDQKSSHASAEPSHANVPDPKEPNWSPEKYRRPWSAKDPLETPDAPLVRSETVSTHGMPETTWVDRRHQKHEHPAPWAHKDPLLPEATVPIVDGGAASRPHAAVPGSPNGVRHVVPHVIDRPTGQPLLVNIQPSQVANVVIPQGGNQALIFGDTNEPHITGQYFDDPSPYPDPEVAAGFTIGGSLKKTEDPTEYMVPPLSSPPINYQQGAEVASVGGVRPSEFPARTEVLVRPASSAPPPPRRSEVGGPPPRRYVVLGKRPSMAANDVPGWKRKPEKKTTVLPIHRPSMVNIRRQPPPSPTRPFPGPNTHEIHGGAAGRPSPYGGRKPSYVISPSRGSNVAKTPDAILTPPYRTPFVSRVPTTIDGQMHVDQFHLRPEVSMSSQQQIFNVTPGYNHHIQSNAHHSNDQNRSDIPITESTLRITKQENVPTGAVEYHDPSTDPEVRPVDAAYYPRLPTVRPEVQSFGQILPHPEDEDENRVRDKWTVATQTERTGSENDSELGESQDTIHRIKEVSVVHGLQFHTPAHDAANPNVNDGPDEGPIIVRGKPFGVYAEEGQTNGDVTGQHSPTLEIDDILVQGVPFGYHGNDPIAPTRPGQEPKDSTSLIVYHPYPHQQHVPNRHENSRPESQGFAEPTPTLIYAAQPTAPSSSGILVLNAPTQYIPGPNLTQISPPSATSHGNGEPQADVYYDEVSTSELNLAGSTYHPMRGDIEIHHGDDDEDDGIEFSLAVDATGEETNSDGQTERPPSMFSVPTTTTTPTSFDVPIQREPVSRTDRPVTTNIRTNVGSVMASAENVTVVKSTRPRPRPPVPHRDMMPPPLNPTMAGKREDVGGTLGLEPPPLFPDHVVGLSPPPLAPVTPPNNSPPSSPLPPPLPPHSSSSLVPPKYIPLAESTNHAASRPFLMEILSQDMVPPAITHETLRPIPELTTIRPTVAVSGSIQLATVETTSQLPISPIVSKSRIPLIHGTTSAIVDVQPSPSTSVFSPQFTRTKHLEDINGYVTNGTVIAVPVDVRPATSRPTIRYATTAHPTKLLRPTYATTLRPHPVDRGEPNQSSTVSDDIRPSRPSAIPTTTTKEATTTEHLKVMDRSSATTRPERVGSSVLLQPSKHNNLPSHTIVPTEALSKDGTVDVGTIISMTTGSMSKPTTTTLNEPLEPLTTVTRAGQQHVSVTSATLRPSFIESPVQDYASTQQTRDGETSEHRHDASHSVVRLSIAKKEKPGEKEDESTTRTHLLTHTMISTTIETVTETLPRITTSTKVTTAPLLTVASTMRPHGTNDRTGDSIFVVMSDHQPPNINAEEVEAEYGSDEDEDLDNDLGKRREGSESPDNEDDDDDEEDRDDEATRDEQDPIGSNEIHRVLAGGILGAPAFPREPTVVGRCLPDCRASKAEVCTEIDGEMRCTCRPGFARMFPDRPCKPIYTYTIRIGLDRIGRDSVVAIAPVLNESTSDEYKRLAESTRDALDRTMMQSDLRDVYRGLKIAGFQADTTSTGVDFHAQFSNNADETKLEEVVRKYLVGNNYSLGGTEVYAAKDLDLVNARDFDECSTTEGGPYHDCSPHAACFNLRGSYQCSCSEGWADLSDNLPAYPGRVCSQAPLGCTACNNKGHCAINSNGQEVCECFPWHTGQRCQVNLKVLLIALVTTGIVLLGLLGACVGFACFGGSRRRGSRFSASRSGDRRAMIAGSNDGCGDTSSEGSAADLAAIPHHVPHVLPAPPKTAAPAPPTTKRHAAATKRNEVSDPVPVAGSGGAVDEQRDRSLTVMIPRAKYRSVPQSPQLPTEVTRVNEKAAAENTNLVVDERKLLGYLEGGSRLADDRRANVANKRRESSSRVETNPEARQVGRSAPTSGSGGTPSGALVSAGFQVSATVMNRFVDAESTLARSCGETTVEPSTRIARSDPIDFPLFTESCVDETTTITNISPTCITRTPTTTAMTETTTTANQSATKLLRLQMSDLGEVGSTLARSCGETTIQPPTRMSSGNKVRRSSSREPRDNASDGHTMAERDVGGTLRMPAQRPPFYNPDSRSSDRESNFDSL